MRHWPMNTGQMNTGQKVHLLIFRLLFLTKILVCVRLLSH